MVKFNKNELKWLVILVGLTYYIYMLLSTKRIYYFIHPRMIKYIYISFIFLVILTLIQVKRLYTTSQKRKIYFSVFIVPIILGLLVNPEGLSGEIAGKKKLSLLENNAIKSSSFLAKGKDKLLKVDNENNVLIVNSSNFTHITDDIIYNDTNKYIGRSINITGFVYKDETTTKNEFVVGRLMIICCAADSEVTGLLCVLDTASSLKTDQWVTVTGTVDKTPHMYSGEIKEIPYIKVEKVEFSKKPDIPYVYPE